MVALLAIVAAVEICGRQPLFAVAEELRGAQPAAPFEAGIVASLTSAPTAVALGGLGTVAGAAIIARRVPGLIGLRWRVAAAGDATTSPASTPTIVAASIDESGTRSI